MQEPAATVHCRKKDVPVVQRAIQGSKKQHAEISGHDVSIDVEGTLANDRCELNTAMFLHLY